MDTHSLLPRDPGDEPDWTFFHITIVMTALSGAFVLVRCGTRLYSQHTLHAEDYLIVVAMVSPHSLTYTEPC